MAPGSRLLKKPSTASSGSDSGRGFQPKQLSKSPPPSPIGERKVTFFEGCLSVAGFAALVPRFHEVQVSGLDEKGEPISWRVSGWPARILQHEVDHLEGTLYVDRMHTRSFGTLAQVKERFSGRPIGQILHEHGIAGP